MSSVGKGAAMTNGGPLTAATPDPAPGTPASLRARSRGSGVTIAIPTIPTRRQLLGRAMGSALMQTAPPAAFAVSIDYDHDGAAVNRNRALSMVATEWTAFLDDDDLLDPDHLEQLLACQSETGADLVYPWFRVHGSTDPLGNFGKPFDADELQARNYVPITYLVRTELAQAVGGFPVPGTPDWPHDECEDWGFLLRLVRADAKIVHLPAITWTWVHHGRGEPGRRGNTSGRGDRW